MKSSTINIRKTIITAILFAALAMLAGTAPAWASTQTDAAGNTLAIGGTAAAGVTLHVTMTGVNQELYTTDPAQIPDQQSLADGTVLYMPEQFIWSGAYGSGETISLTNDALVVRQADANSESEPAPAVDQAEPTPEADQSEPAPAFGELDVVLPYVGTGNFTGVFRQYQLQTDAEGVRSWVAGDTSLVRDKLTIKGRVLYDAGKGTFKNGNSVKTKYYTNGAKLTGRPTPKAKKKFFLGWYTKKNGGKQITGKMKVHFGKKQTVRYYAHWETKGEKSPVISYKGKNATRIPVLCYHRLCSPSEKRKHRGSFSSLFMSETKFRQEMKWLHDHHYTTLSMKEFYLWHQGKIKVPRKSVVITFDDGMYSIIKYGLPILEKYDMKATMFMIGKAVPNKTNKRPTRYGTYHTTGRDVIDYVSKKYPDFEFQSHTWGLHVRTGSGAGYAKTKSYNYQKKDFEKMYKKFGYEYLAYPFGHYTSRTIRAAKKGHIKMAFTYGSNTWATRSQGRYTIRRIKADGDESLSRFTRWFYK